jgi:hypothetical protein
MKKFSTRISDMESDGVYFPAEVKDELEKRREELVCQYSALPSVMSYLDDNQDKIESNTNGKINLKNN